MDRTCRWDIVSTEMCDMIQCSAMLLSSQKNAEQLKMQMSGTKKLGGCSKVFVKELQNNGSHCLSFFFGGGPLIEFKVSIISVRA